MSTRSTESVTIAAAAAAYDLDMARARMQASSSEQVVNAEWRDLTDDQRQMFMSLGVTYQTPQPQQQGTP